MPGNETILTSVNVDKVKQLISNTETNVDYFNSTIVQVVKKHSESLDNLMSDLYIECIKNKNAVTSVLEQYYLELSNMIYFMIEKLEQLSVFADMSKSASKEVYSKSYLSNQVKESGTGKNKTTVAELQAQAEIDAQYEMVVSSIYEHAYKIVKGKIDSGKDMMNTLRKIITHRMNEEQLSMYSNSKFTPTTRGDTEE
jgi:hypothetical protein